MAKLYTKEEFWKLYKNLPAELQDVLFSEETSDNIHNICEKNGVFEKLSDIVDYVGGVLIGVLSPDDFQKKLEKDLKIERETAQKVGREIHRFVFYPVKAALEEIYNIEITGVPSPLKLFGMETGRSTRTEKSEPAELDKYREFLEASEEEKIFKTKAGKAPPIEEKEEKTPLEAPALPLDKEVTPPKEDAYKEPLE